MNKEPGIKLIFSMRLAGYLMQRGFVLIEMRKNLDQTNRNVFLFKASEELKKAIDDYGGLAKN